jgi:hypothetical protein
MLPPVLNWRMLSHAPGLEMLWSAACYACHIIPSPEKGSENGSGAYFLPFSGEGLLCYALPYAAVVFYILRSHE